MQLRKDTSGLSGGSSLQSPAARLAAEHGWPAFSRSSVSAERCSRLLKATGRPASSLMSNGPRILNRI